ncbi:MAG: hypothetical protein KAT38_00730 [Bacteroidales bacterium]|nr:hypothetical protein [Bacteroidales bacterium]
MICRDLFIGIDDPVDDFEEQLVSFPFNDDIKTNYCLNTWFNKEIYKILLN